MSKRKNTAELMNKQLHDHDLELIFILSKKLGHNKPTQCRTRDQRGNSDQKQQLVKPNQCKTADKKPTTAPTVATKETFHKEVNSSLH